MAVSKTFNLNAATHERAARKLLLTVAEWRVASSTIYSLTLEEPGDWSTNYTDYYTESSGTYTKVTGETAPTWAANTYYYPVKREILGRRTEDSSIEYNVDMENTTDILGINYADINKTQPQQDFDPHLVLGGDELSELLNDIRRRNALTELSQFTLYIITVFIGDSTNGYAAERHDECTITYTAIGGDSNVNFPISVYFSNKITLGTVDKTSKDFVFSPDNNVNI